MLKFKFLHKRFNNDLTSGLKTTVALLPSDSVPKFQLYNIYYSSCIRYLQYFGTYSSKFKCIGSFYVNNFQQKHVCLCVCVCVCLQRYQSEDLCVV